MNCKLGNLVTRVLLPLLGTLFLSAVAQAQISVFDPATGNVALPLLKKDDNYYTNAVLSLTANGGWNFSQPGSDSFPSTKVAAPYSTSAGTLSIPYLQIDNYYFYDVVLSLPVGKPWSLKSYGDFNQFVSTSPTLTFPVVTTVDNKWATDTGGVMSYRLDNGQVWRIVTDDPCFPPLTVPTGAPPAGSSNVRIYPNPDNATGYYLMITEFGNAEESCIVQPVEVPGLQVALTGLPFGVSTSAVTGVVGKSYDIYLSGGTKPYMLKLDNTQVASVQLLPQVPEDNQGQMLRVKLLTPGSATMSLFDYNRLKTQVSLVAQSDLHLNLGEISVPFGTPPATIRIYGGVPPFHVDNPLPQWIGTSDPVAISPTESVMQVRFLADTGDTKMPVTVIDSTGATATVSITIKASASSTTGGTGSTGSTGTGTTTSKPYK